LDALIIITILTGGLDIVIGAIGSFIAGAIEFFAGLGPAIGGVISSIPAIFTTLFSKINFGSVVSACTTAFSKLPGAISSAITRIPEIVSGIFQKAWGPISSFFGGISNFVTSMGGRGFSFSGITGFATGGIIGRDSIVRVGEGGRNEAIIPLQDGSAMAPFADAVAARLGMNSGGGQQQTSNSQQPILYVGTLIADDRSLKELNRRMQVVQLKENDRGVR
jgi:hypothetical protein